MSTTTTQHGSLYIKTPQGWVQISLGVDVSDISDLNSELDSKVKITEFISTDNNTHVIKKDYIPTEILAGMTYGGVCTINTNSTATATLSTQGAYITGYSGSVTLNSTNAGNYNGLFFIVENTTDKAFITRGADNEDISIVFNTGDWLVSTQTGWHKIDNTDLVTSVNGHTGPVNIYRDSWNSSLTYNKGDVVSANNNLYIYINSNSSAGNAVTNTSYWRSFGKDWSSEISSLSNKVSGMVNTANTLPSYTVSSNAPTTITSYANGSVWIKLENNNN